MFRRTFWQYAYREVITRKARSTGVAAGLALGIALFVALTALSDGYRRLVALPFQQLNVDVTIQRSGAAVPTPKPNSIRLPPSNQPISPNQLERIASLLEWEALSRSLLLWEHTPEGFVVVFGIEPAEKTGPARVQEWISKGTPLSRTGQVLLEKHFARIRGYRPGQDLRVGGQIFNVTGLVDLKKGNTVAKADVYMLIQDAEGLAGLPPGSANMLFGRLPKGYDPDGMHDEMSGILPGALVSTTDNIRQMMKGFDRISGGFSTLLSGLSLFFAAIVCYRLLSGSVFERKKEIGVMKVIGWQNRDISRAFTMETLLLGAAGGLAGLAAGYAGAYVLGSFDVTLNIPWNLNPVPAKGIDTAPFQSNIPVSFSIPTAGLALGVSLVLAAATGWVVSKKLTKIKPMEAIRQL